MEEVPQLSHALVLKRWRTHTFIRQSASLPWYSNEEVSKIQIVRKRYIGSKQNILSTGKSNVALHSWKKGTFEFNFAPVTCYLIPENFHLSNTMRRPSEEKNSWISHLSQQSISHYYSEVQKGRTDILYIFTPSMSENGIRLNGILQTWIDNSLETCVSSSLIKSARFSLLFYLALKPSTYSLYRKVE